MRYELRLPHTIRRDSVTVPRIWVAAALSVLVHALVLWHAPPQLRRPSSDITSPDARGPLVVELAPAPAPPRAQPSAPAPRPPRVASRPKPSAPPTPERRRAQPPLLALEKPASPPAAPATPPSAPAPSPPSAAQKGPSAADLLAYVEAKRNARRDFAPPSPSSEAPPSAPVPEDENARANRIAAANLGLGRKPEFGGERRPGGGIFEIRRMGYDSAEFMFYGWNKDMRRFTPQLIEVRKDQSPDIRIAVIRRMIAIIRDHEQGDFIWESHRLGRNVTLSARPRDQAGLEAFLMREFFGDAAAARR